MVILSRPLTFDVRRDGKIQGDPPGRRKARRAVYVVAFASSSAGRVRRTASSTAGGGSIGGSIGISPKGSGGREGKHGITPIPALRVGARRGGRFPWWLSRARLPAGRAGGQAPRR